MYTIEDMNNEEISGTFYEPELVKYDKLDQVYKIEKVLKKEEEQHVSSEIASATQIPLIVGWT